MEKYFAPQVFPVSNFRPLGWPSVWNRHMCFGRCYLGISCLATPGHILTQLQTFCQRDRGVLTPEWDVSNFTSSQSTQAISDLFSEPIIFNLSSPPNWFPWWWDAYSDVNLFDEEDAVSRIYKNHVHILYLKDLVVWRFLLLHFVLSLTCHSSPLILFYLDSVALSGKQHILSIHHRSVKLSMRERHRDREHFPLKLLAWEHNLYRKHLYYIRTIKKKQHFY